MGERDAGYFDGEKFCFDDEDDLPDDDEEICMVDVRGSLQREQLADTASQDIGVEEGSALVGRQSDKLHATVDG